MYCKRIFLRYSFKIQHLFVIDDNLTLFDKKMINLEYHFLII